MPDALRTSSEASIIRTAALALLIVLALKLHFAAVLDLYSDEIFYWLESTRPALAYSDLPFVTALLAGFGNSLSPGNPLAVRFFFLLMGSCVPLLVFWLASAVVDRRQAIEAGALSLCLPLAGFLGLLAVPDVPLIFFGLLATGCFMRALQHNAWHYWITTGVIVALGLSTHYRFLLYPAAVFFFLLGCSGARVYWKNPRFWIAVTIAASGLAPVVWFNLTQQLASATFYLVDRHPWEFQPMGLMHLFKQAGLVTPPMYGLLLFTLWIMWRKVRNGDRNAALLFSLSITNLAVYLVLAPWTDANSTSIHWPLSGYFPILVYAPQAIRQLAQWLGERLPNRQIGVLAVTVFSIGFLGTIIAITGVGSQAYQTQLQKVLGAGVLSNKMAGWKEFAIATGQLMQNEFPDQQPVLLTDNYYTAAQLQFAGLAEQVYTLDTDKAVRDGRMHQLRLWGMDQTGLFDEAISGSPLLLITEDSTLEVEDKHALLLTACELVTTLQASEQLYLFAGDKQFSYYRGEGLTPGSGSRAAPCPLPMRAWIDQPEAGAELAGSVQVSGWAYNEEIGVKSIELLIDGEAVTRMNYDIPRPDVADVMKVTSDPNSPMLGYTGLWDTTSMQNGWHQLELLLRNSQGHTLHYGKRRVLINN